MSSQVAGDLSLIESGPCSLRYDGELLGHTMEGVRLNMPSDLRKRMTDEYGTDFASCVFQGDNIEVSTTLAEKTLGVMAAVFAWGYEIDLATWGWGRLPGYMSDDIGAPLILHPLEMLNDTSKDVTFWSMVTSAVREIEFGEVSSDRVFGVTWTAVIDESKRSGYMLGRMGLGAEVVAPDVVITRTLDDLSTRFAEHTGAAASIRFKLTTTANGSPQTTADFIYLDTSGGVGTADNVLESATNLAAAIQAALVADFPGTTVSGESQEAGDKYVFTATFPAALGVTALEFDASSQWYPTIAFVESVDSEGVEDEPGASERFTVVCNGANSGGGETVTFGDGSVTGQLEFGSADSVIANYIAPSGFSLVSGGIGFVFATFEADAAADRPDFAIIGQTHDGTYDLSTAVQGSDPVSGSAEVHTITPDPVVPTGGTLKLGPSGTAIPFDASTAAIGINIDPATGWAGSSAVGTFDAGAVEITNGSNGNVGDIGAENIDLTAAEITRA